MPATCVEDDGERLRRCSNHDGAIVSTWSRVATIAGISGKKDPEELFLPSCSCNVLHPQTHESLALIAPSST